MFNVKCENFHILLASSSLHGNDVGNPVNHHSTDPQHTHGEDELHQDIEDIAVNISTDTNISSSLSLSSNPISTAVENPLYESANDSISSVSSLPPGWVSQKDRHNKDHKEDILVPKTPTESNFDRNNMDLSTITEIPNLVPEVI